MKTETKINRPTQLSQPLTYKSWKKMKSRCYNQNNNRYHYYGGKGIKVCERWKSSFENFFNDVGPRPSEKHTLDRIDSSKDYSPENCRWATYTEQLRNRPSFCVVESIGLESKCLSAWSEEYGINYKTFHSRISSGMPFYQALTKPVRKINKKNCLQ